MIVYPMRSDTSKFPVFVFSICLLLLLLFTIPYSFIVSPVGLAFPGILSTGSPHLSYRSFSVSIDSHLPFTFPLSCGVPQGSALGSILCNLYTTLSTIISKSSLSHHLYTDDTQLFIPFVLTKQKFVLAFSQLDSTISLICSWMTANLFTLNPSVTDFMLISLSQQLSIVSSPSLSLSSFYPSYCTMYACS